MRNLAKSRIRYYLLAIVGAFYLTAFTVEWDRNAMEMEVGPEAWADFKNWYKVTKKPNTGDPTGFLDGKHMDVSGYRDVYINSAGEATNKGEAAFPYPEGTIIVKEAFKNEKAWNEQKKPELTQCPFAGMRI